MAIAGLENNKRGGIADVCSMRNYLEESHHHMHRYDGIVMLDYANVVSERSAGKGEIRGDPKDCHT